MHSLGQHSCKNHSTALANFWDNVESARHNPMQRESLSNLPVKSSVHNRILWNRVAGVQRFKAKSVARVSLRKQFLPFHVASFPFMSLFFCLAVISIRSTCFS
jgi:hypothetical protein